MLVVSRLLQGRWACSRYTPCFMGLIISKSINSSEMITFFECKLLKMAVLLKLSNVLMLRFRLFWLYSKLIINSRQSAALFILWFVRWLAVILYLKVEVSSINNCIIAIDQAKASSNVQGSLSSRSIPEWDFNSCMNLSTSIGCSCFSKAYSCFSNCII